MRILGLTSAVIAAVIALGLLGRSDAVASPHQPLFWKSAPPPGARILARPGSHSALTIEAAAADPKQHVTLSLLGSGSARLSAKSGNPAVGVIRVIASAQDSERSFAVTFVARVSGPRRLAITRTVIVVVPARAMSLVGPGAVSRWAYVLRRTDARAEPTNLAPLVAVVPTATSDAQPNLVLALAQQKNAAGISWVRVRLVTLPNSRTGWVKRGDLSNYRRVTTELVVDTRRFTLTLYVRGRRAFRAPVGVGRPSSPTPTGNFYIREELTDFHDPFYGPVAFGTSARSAVLTEWPGGGIVGIHGTNEPDLIPGRISHGCIRLRNSDITRLARLLPLGTPLVIR